MGKTMIITLLLTTMAGLGIIKLQAFALGNDTVKSFLTQFNGGRSMGHRAPRLNCSRNMKLLTAHFSEPFHQGAGFIRCKHTCLHGRPVQTVDLVLTY